MCCVVGIKSVCVSVFACLFVCLFSCLSIRCLLLLLLVGLRKKICVDVYEFFPLVTDNKLSLMGESGFGSVSRIFFNLYILPYNVKNEAEILDTFSIDCTMLFKNSDQLLKWQYQKQHSEITAFY